SRHESAACSRWAGVIVTCISFSASAKVAGDTGGPEPGPVPNVGGAPAVVGPDCELAGRSALLRQGEVAMSTPRGARIRNCRLEFIGQQAYTRSLAGASRGQLALIHVQVQSIPRPL